MKHYRNRNDTEVGEDKQGGESAKTETESKRAVKGEDRSGKGKTGDKTRNSHPIKY